MDHVLVWEEEILSDRWKMRQLCVFIASRSAWGTCRWAWPVTTDELPGPAPSSRPTYRLLLSAVSKL
jgi:hypothetical protein